MPIYTSPSPQKEDISSEIEDNSTEASDAIIAGLLSPRAAWTQSFALLHGMGQSLLTTIGEAIDAGKAVAAQSEFRAAFGEKEAPADAYLAVGGFALKLHEQDARLRGEEGAVAPTAAMPLTGAEMEILRRFLERV